jgi:7 transmembrane sweet-taste receptor of 3 GCPR
MFVVAQRRKNRVQFAVALALLILCASEQQQHKVMCADVTVPLGLVFPQIGDFTSSIVFGAQYLIDSIAGAGGVELDNGDRAFFELNAALVGFNDFEATRQAVSDLCDAGVRVFIGPLTSSQVEVAALALYECRERTGEPVVMTASTANSNALFVCPLVGWEDVEPCAGPGLRRFDFLWGVFPDVDSEADTMLSPYLRVRPATVAFLFQQGNPFTDDLLRRGEAIAADNHMRTVVSASYVRDEVNLNVTQANVESAFADAIVGLEVPELFVSDACEHMFLTMASFDYAPKGVAVSCLGDAVEGRYSVEAAVWDVRLRGSAFVEQPAVFPSFFYDGDRPAPQVFIERIVESDDENGVAAALGRPEGAAVSATSVTVLANAMWRAGSASSTNAFVGATVLNGVWGRVQYGPFGKMQGRACGGLAYQTDRANVPQIVEPVSSNTAELVYPMPAWDERANSQSYLSESYEVALVAVAGVCMGVSALVALVIGVQWSHPVWVSAQRIFCLAILFGSTLVYGSTMLWTLYATDGTCTAMTWLLTIGVSLIMATLCSKTFRVFRVFRNRRLQQRAITNADVLLMVAALNVVPLLLLIVWTALGGLQAEMVIVSDDILSENYWQCDVDTQAIVFVSLLLSYVGVLLVAAAVIAFLVRNVRFLLYNESKYIALSIYTLIVFGALIIGIQASGAIDREANYVIRTILLLACTLLIMAFLFAPKIWFVAAGKAAEASTKGSLYTESSNRDARATPALASPWLATTSTSINNT